MGLPAVSSNSSPRTLMRSPSIGSSPSRPSTVRQLRPRRTRALGSDGGTTLAPPAPAAPIPATPARAIRARDTAVLLVVTLSSSFETVVGTDLLGIRWRRHPVRVEDRPQDVRPIRVAALEGHDHFIVDLGKGEHAATRAGERLRHADPARAVGIAFALAVPMELDLHAAVLVREDLLAGGANDHRGLRARDHRPWRAA